MNKPDPRNADDLVDADVCAEEAKSSDSAALACSTAERELNEIYETQAIDGAMFLMGRLNRGQVKRIRETNPNMADFYVECLSR